MGITASRYKLVLAYDGTRYSGWQRQPGVETVQGTLEAALRRLFGEEIQVTGSGRTDAGVHALAQVAHVDLMHALAPVDLHGALNGQLPPAIRVRHVSRVPSTFHARYSALRRRYLYIIKMNREFSPFLAHYVYQVSSSLDLRAMSEAAGKLVGTHDFSAFRASKGGHTPPVRTVFHSEVLPRRGDLLMYLIEADAFLRKMVRGIVGTLLEIGQGKLPPEVMNWLLVSHDRTLMGTIAPPQGLYLADVSYAVAESDTREA